MEIRVNGQPHAFASAPTVTELLRDMGLEGKRVAVECNGGIVPKSRHADARLADGDRLEIVVAVGGG